MYEVGGRSYNWCGWNVSRVSGSIYDGWWSLTCTVPQTARAGAYTVTPYASDSLENWTNMNGQDESPARATFTVSAAAEEIPTQATDVRGVVVDDNQPNTVRHAVGADITGDKLVLADAVVETNPMNSAEDADVDQASHIGKPDVVAEVPEGAIDSAGSASIRELALSAPEG